MATGNQKELDLLKQLCRTDLRFLCTEMLGIEYWEPKLHDDLALQLNANTNRKLILMPRGHLKSTISTVAWSIQQLLKDSDTRILITNAVWERSREFLRQIQGYLTDKSPLPDLFGPFDGPGSRFTQDEITIAQKGNAGKRGPSIRTAGLESALTGSHCDVIIHDDLVEESNIGTKEQIQKVIRFYENSLDLLDPGGKLVVIGTRWAISDLYGHIIETDMDTFNGRPVIPEQRGQWRKFLNGQPTAVQ